MNLETTRAAALRRRRVAAAKQRRAGTNGGASGLGEGPAAPLYPPAFTAITQQAMDEARIIAEVLTRLEGTP